jgi:hypothetical protein
LVLADGLINEDQVGGVKHALFSHPKRSSNGNGAEGAMPLPLAP